MFKSYLFDEAALLLDEDAYALVPLAPFTFLVPSMPFTWASNASNRLLGAFFIYKIKIILRNERIKRSCNFNYFLPWLDLEYHFYRCQTPVEKN